MDHRCLYGHRVPVSFTFAIQNRSCPTCGAPTVSINGYQAARKLATDAAMDAVVAFNAVRILESEWTLVPAGVAAPATALTSGHALVPEAAAATDEEVVIVEDSVEPPVSLAPAEPRITARVKADRRADRVEARVEPKPPTEVDAPPVPVRAAGGFGEDEEDFFKQA